MNKQEKIQQIKYFTKNQIEADHIDKSTLIISDANQAFIGLAVASQHPDTNVVFEGEAEAVVKELIDSSESEKMITQINSTETTS